MQHGVDCNVDQFFEALTRPPSIMPCPQNHISYFSPSPDKVTEIPFDLSTHRDTAWREPSSVISKLDYDKSLSQTNPSRGRKCGTSRLRTFQAEPTHIVVRQWCSVN